MNKRTSEGPETLTQEYLTRRIPFCSVHLLDIIWKVILKKEAKMDHTKMYQADLDSPCRELFVPSLRFVVALLFFWEIIFLCASTGKAI